jgi:hypothetical protein
LIGIKKKLIDNTKKKPHKSTAQESLSVGLRKNNKSTSFHFHSASQTPSSRNSIHIKLKNYEDI